MKVTIQALGWRSGGRYLPLQDDIASVAFWYQAAPQAKFPKFPDKDALENVIELLRNRKISPDVPTAKRMTDAVTKVVRDL